MKTESILYNNKIQLKQTQASAFIIALVLCCLFGMFFTTSYFVRLKSTCKVILADKINPNTAPLASLQRLPNIGPKRAAAIVEYRRNVVSRTVAFGTCADLQNIKGIGPKTAESIGPLLRFE